MSAWFVQCARVVGNTQRVVANNVPRDSTLLRMEPALRVLLARPQTAPEVATLILHAQVTQRRVQCYKVHMS